MRLRSIFFVICFFLGVLAGVVYGSPAQIDRAVARDQKRLNVVAKAMKVIHQVREQDRKMTGAEKQLVATAERYVKEGSPVPSAYQPIARFGHRKRQTLLSLADVGPGHRAVTLTQKELLDGLIAHNEYIDRETMKVAPYRMISAKENGLVRLRSAGDVPVTVYFGRPNYQPNFKTDKVTPIDQTAASATAVFKNGVADVKVAMDGLSATEAVEFMQGVRKNVQRRKNQFLSAAFNLNTPLVDDRPSTIKKLGRAQRLTDPAAIAELGADLAKAGGWNKVAWDGASDKYIPSMVFLELLGGLKNTKAGAKAHAAAYKKGVKELTGLVHDAHSMGLETYISAGMRDEHMAGAVQAGVDGVGVGFSMHHRDPGSGVVGPLAPEKIKSAITIRNDAEATVLGRGAKKLAQLDSLYANGRLKAPQAKVRSALFKALSQQNETKVAQLIGG